MLARTFPHPLLSVVVGLLWLLLANQYTPGTMAMAAIIGWAVPRVTRTYWPDSARIRRPLAIAEYFATVLKDIVMSNVQVAYLVLFRRGDTLRSRYIAVPLDLTSAEAITVLAATITMTPGTVSADLAADGRALLVHCLEVGDPDAAVAGIKRRYERLLMEIFQ